MIMLHFRILLKLVGVLRQYKEVSFWTQQTCSHVWLQVFRVIQKSKAVLRLLYFKLFVLDVVKNICSLFFADLFSGWLFSQ